MKRNKHLKNILSQHSNYLRIAKTNIRNFQHRITHPPFCTIFCLFKSTESKLVRVRPAATPSGFNLREPTKKQVKYGEKCDDWNDLWCLCIPYTSRQSLGSTHIGTISHASWSKHPCASQTATYLHVRFWWQNPLYENQMSSKDLQVHDELCRDISTSKNPSGFTILIHLSHLSHPSNLPCLWITEKKIQDLTKYTSNTKCIRDFVS